MHPPAVYPGSLAQRVIQWECNLDLWCMRRLQWAWR